jgi:hypothetical protein
MLSDYLNQKAVFTPALRGKDNSALMDCRGNTLYGAEADIPVRRESAERELLTSDKQIVRITDMFYAETEVRAGDMLDGKRVQHAVTWTDLDGEAVIYMAAV